MLKNLLFSAILCFIFQFSNIYAQAPGNTCATAVTLTLPAIGNTTSYGQQTTLGRGNNFTTGSYCASASYGGGEDGVYSINVPTGGGSFTFSFSEINGNTWKILSIHTGCAPTTANCVGGFTTGGSSGGTTTLFLDAGRYYLIIDTYPSPDYATFNLSITSNPPPTSYCIPAPTSVDNQGITNVSFSNVNNTTGAESGNYGNYSSQIGTAFEGTTLPVNITYQTGYTYNTTIWVDWNDDFVFAPSEVVYIGESTNGNPTTLAASFLIPAGTATSGNGTGLHRMRIGGRDSGPVTDPCYTGSYGCFEDYSIQVLVPANPTITSLSATQGCTGDLININGTNFLGATVRIGATVSTITANTGTTITVRVGTGTTGPVTVTTPGGTATSATSFTVNTLPANPGAPTSDSPQCNPPGVTLTRAGTVPDGITWYWQTASNGTSTANSDPTYTVSVPGTYYIRAQNASGCWSSGAGARTVVVTTPNPNAAVSPNPTNGRTGVCYAGSNPITSLTWGNVANTTSYDVYFGTNPVPPFVGNRTVNNYPTGVLAANTTYYWKIVPKNACGDRTDPVVTWSFTTSAAPCHCIPTNTYSTSYYISGVTTTGGLANINNTPTGFSAYTDYTSRFVSQFPGLSFNLTATHPSSTYGYKVWIDWNNDGDFDDAGENVFTSVGYVATPANLGTITIPGGQAAGDYRMRIRNAYLNNPPPACGAFNYGEAEDYTVRVVLPALPTITGLSGTEGCAGSPLTITGTDFIGATVRIGGTLANITSNNGSSINVTVGSGTTGTVTVTTPGGTATSATTFTVYPLPLIPPNTLTSNSPQCTTTGVTISHPDTAPLDITWYWQTVSNGTDTTLNAATPLLVMVSGTTYIRAQNNITGCWSAGSRSINVVVSNPILAIATNPVPADGASGVCIAGVNPRTTITWGAVANATNYDVFFGTATTPPLVSADQTTRNYSFGVLLPNTTYYWSIIPKNACGDTAGIPIIWSFTTANGPCYCTLPNVTTNTTYIDNFSTSGGVENILNLDSGFTPGGYQDNYDSMVVSQFVTGAVGFNLQMVGGTAGVAVWVDWNNNGVFETGERMFNHGSYTDGPINAAFNVPNGTALGDYRMRVKIDWLSTSPDPCTNGGTRAETEDYKFTVITMPPCGAQPTNLTSSLITTTTARISWTAATPNPAAGYDYYYSTSPTPPSAGTTPSGSVGSGVVFANLASLTPGTTYYFWVRSNCNATEESAWSITNTFMTTIINDECGGAITLTVNDDYDCAIVTSATTVGATQSPQPDDVTGTPDNDVWFSFVATGPEHRISLLNIVAIYGTSTDMGIGVYSSVAGACSTLTFVGTSDPEIYNVSGLIAGTTYLVRVYGWYSGTSSAQANFNICIGTPPPPPTCGETFYDSGGPFGDYSSSESKTTTILPNNPNHAVTVTFTSFNTEANYDRLSVYDGPNNSYPLLGTFSGTALPGPFTSSDPSGALTFVFISDTSVTRSGWAADITCESICNVTITDTIYPLGADSCSLDYTELVGATIPPTSTRIPIFSENFNGTNFPTGWGAINGPGSANWNISNSSDAGGSPNEVRLTGGYDSTSTGTWTLASPNINIAGQTNMELSFKQYLYHYSTSYPYSIFIETRLNGGPWVVQHQVNPVSNNISPETRNINLSALSGNTLQVRFRLTGNPFGLHYWYIDNVEISIEGIPIPPVIIWSPITDLYTDAALTIPYTGASSETVYAAPNGTQIYTVTDHMGCTETVTVINSKKVWNGSNSTDWYSANNWTPSGTPTETDCIDIPDRVATHNRSPIVDISNYPIPTPPPPAFAKNLLVRTNGELTVNANSFIEIKEGLTVEDNADVLIMDSGSLIQIDDVTTNNNAGKIRMQRTVPGGVLPQNYVYWSSPVEGFEVEDINTATSEQRFKWKPSIDGVHNGIWETADEVMVVGKGYIVKGLATPPSPIPLQTAEFSGRPSNGIINTPITRGTYTQGPYPAEGGGNTLATNIDDNWNLVGNPYPSAISANAFITENTEGSTPKIDGTIYLWSHMSLPSGTTEQDPFYGNYVYNYLGSDYIAFNGTGPNPPVFDGNIAAGQSFFVQMLDVAGITNTLNFNNTMRSGQPANDNFLRSGERHRIWLDLVDQTNNASSTLVGYVTDATNEKDRLYDGHNLSSASLQFYSMLGEEEMTIQGRALPFEQEDRVPLGFVVPQKSSYKIAINTLDGLFGDASQTIYLEDTYMNTIFDLRIAPYAFTSEIGTFNDRFILRYTNETLSTPDQVANFGFNIIGLKDYIKVTSGNSLISTVKVYDVLGRVLADYKNINALEFKFDLVNQSEGALIVKATLNNGQQKIKKVIY